MNRLIHILSVVIVTILSLNTCNKIYEVDYLKDQYDHIESELKASENREVKLESDIDLYKDSVERLERSREVIKEKSDSIKEVMLEDEKKFSILITEARGSTQKEADSVLNELFESSVDNLVAIREFDSLKLKHRSVTHLYDKQVEDNLVLSEINSFKEKVILKKDSIIQERGFRIEKKDETISLKDKEILNEKKKQPKIFIAGVGVGVTVTGLLYLINRN